MSESRKGRVLLVDDDSGVLRAYSRILRNAELDVVEANDGQTAVSMLEQGGFDTVVSDIAMPRLSGLGLLEAIRRHDSDVPVILLTGSPKLDSAMRAVEHGAFRYLAKPVDKNDFVAVVRQATRMYKLAVTKRRALELLEREEKQIGDRNDLEANFESALSSLWMAYQPIISYSEQRVFAYEALLRCNEPSMPHPGALIDAADKLGRMHELSNTIQKSVAETIRTIPTEAQIFVNLHVRDLLDERLFGEEGPLDPYASRVVLEITERASLDDVPDVQGRVARLRNRGYRIAVDDLGAGYAGLSTFTQLEPEVVKLDMLLIRDIDQSPTKQKLVQSMATLCAEMGAQVVAEGIETEAEADCAVDLGCDLLQGYRFAKPGKPFPPVTGF